MKQKFKLFAEPLSMYLNELELVNYHFLTAKTTNIACDLKSVSVIKSNKKGINHPNKKLTSTA